VYYHWVKEGPLGSLLDMGRYELPTSEAMHEHTSKFQSLKQLWDAENLPKHSTGPFSDIEIDAFSETLDVLIEKYGAVFADSPDLDTIGVVYSWPIRVPDLFIQMVNRKRPEALVLLAHYCLLLNKVDYLWWMQGIGRHLLQSIHKVLGDEWESWIVWPLQDLVLSEFRNRNCKEEAQYSLRVREP
jgi:hypothetical protein